ncbi:unnamed protein product [Sphagnum jensenii]|uniref:Uncharacterized protein n=1 Tax=Sphagnum jensenii TaxID=128206 RepID=A0ABP1A2B4_9BRYO
MRYCPLQVQEALLCFAICSLEIYPLDLEETQGCYPLLQWKHGEVLPTDLAVEEHPEGGANALNLNRLSGRAVHPEELQNAGALVNYMLEESLAFVQQENSYIDQKTKNEGDQITENFGEDDEKEQKKPGAQSMEELVEGAQCHYDDIPLLKLAERAKKLPYVESLCIHEMVVIAFKHVLQAVVAT